MTQDTRIPVGFGPADAGAAWLIEGNAPAPAGTYAAHFTRGPAPHLAGCACCAPGRDIVAALAGLFRAKVTGAATFERVVVKASPEGEAAIRAALDGDVLVRARFRRE